MGDPDCRARGLCRTSGSPCPPEREEGISRLWGAPASLPHFLVTLQFFASGVSALIMAKMPKSSLVSLCQACSFLTSRESPRGDSRGAERKARGRG